MAMAMAATPTPCLLFPSALNHRCPSMLPALHRPSFHPASSSSPRLSSPSPATFSHRPSTQFFVRAAQSSAQNESATAEELDARKERLRDLSVKFFNFNTCGVLCALQEDLQPLVIHMVVSKGCGFVSCGCSKVSFVNKWVEDLNLESPSSNPSRTHRLLNPHGNSSKACAVPSDMSSFEILQKHSSRTYHCVGCR